MNWFQQHWAFLTFSAFFIGGYVGFWSGVWTKEAPDDSKEEA